MSKNLIAEYIDPYRAAEQSLTLSGEINLDVMPRLQTNVLASDNPVKVSLAFGRDAQGFAFLHGKLHVFVVLQCQRCMDSYVYEIMSDFNLGIVTTLDEANALPENYEPALSQEGRLAVHELIEDEIILNLPIIPRHEVEECSIKLPLRDQEWQEEKKVNPFQMLRNFKQKEK